jgi:uncharacterized protein (TIGR03435 family)
MGTKIDGARVDMGFASLMSLIVQAYQVEGYQVSGPDWLLTSRFDILAKMPEGANIEQIPEMLQSLLADRFGLKLRREPREQQVYALIPAKDGAKLKQTPADFVVTDDPFSGAGRGGRAVLQVIQPLPPGGWQTVSAVNGHQVFETKKIAMAEFARFVKRYVDEPVVNLTGLNGFYEIAMDVPTMARRPGRAGAMAAPEEPSDPSGVSIFASIQKLGLKLERRKMALEQLVVEHIEKAPTEN